MPKLILIKHAMPDDRVVREPGHVKNPSVGANGCHLLRKFATTCSGHYDISDQQIDHSVEFLDQPQAFFTVCSREYPVTLVLENLSR